MLHWGNTAQRYGIAAIALHWSAALLLLALLALGLWMVRLPDAGWDSFKIILILAHKQLGVFAFLLAALRLAWRTAQPLPALAESLPAWQQFAARFVHLCLYALMFALPVTGWLMSSAAGFPISLLGGPTVPDLVPVSDLLFREFALAHRWLAYALLAAVAGHAGAAVRHQFVRRDGTLDKMLGIR